MPLLLTFFNAKHERENERLRRSAPGSDGGFIDGPFFLVVSTAVSVLCPAGSEPASLMYYSAATRTLLLHLGERLIEQGRLSSPEDVFYLTIEARADLLAGGSRDWQGMIQTPRAERDHNAMMTVPDTIQDWREAVRGTDTSAIVDPDGVFRGIPISGGLTGRRLMLLANPESALRTQHFPPACPLKIHVQEFTTPSTIK